MHRIPPKNMNNNMQNQRVVLVMHGLLGCSADWLITGNRSIGIKKLIYPTPLDFFTNVRLVD